MDTFPPIKGKKEKVLHFYTFIYFCCKTLNTKALWVSGQPQTAAKDRESKAKGKNGPQKQHFSITRTRLLCFRSISSGFSHKHKGIWQASSSSFIASKPQTVLAQLAGLVQKNAAS